MKLTTEYPVSLILLCALLAIAFAFLLYRNDKSLRDMHGWLVKVLWGLRFLAVFIISLFLLSPVLKTIHRTIEKPIVLFVQDNSRSLRLTSDSTYYIEKYPEQIKAFLADLSDKFDVRTASFSENLESKFKFDYNGQTTDLSQTIRDIETAYLNKNLGAVILASDGIYNQGDHPAYSLKKSDYTLYALALGDTSVYADAGIQEVRHNQMAFLGDNFPVQVFVVANKMKGRTIDVSIIKDGTELDKKSITVSGESFSLPVNFLLKAESPGLQKYTIRITTPSDDHNPRNNTRNVVIEVVENKQKILFLAQSPHPDINAMRNALTAFPNFETEFFTIENYDKPYQAYDVVVLHQLPGQNKTSLQLIQKILTSDKAVLLVVGSQSSIPVLNSLNLGLNIQQENQLTEEAQAVVNPQFGTFSTDPEVADFLNQAPPLLVPFGNIKTSGGYTPWLYQRIKGTPTRLPLIVFSSEGSVNQGRRVVVFGEGIWRWRLYDFQQNSSHESFDVVVEKCFRFLSLNLNKSPFQLRYRQIVAANEQLIFQAEVYNSNFEHVKGAVVSLDIQSSTGQEFNYNLAETGGPAGEYYLNAGLFPSGEYKIKANAKFGDKSYQKQGSFVVMPVDNESLQLTANHSALAQAAAATPHGGLYSPDQLKALKKALETNENIVALSYQQKDLYDIIHLRWIFFLLLLTLGAEWFLRKYHGAL